MKHFLLPAFALLLGIWLWTAYADRGHDLDNNAQQQSESSAANGEHGHSDEGAHHQHGEWIEPPEAYAGRVSTKRADADAIARGEEIYQEQCVA